MLAKVVHKPHLLNKKEHENDLHDGERLRVREKKETDKCLFFIIFLYMLAPENTDIYGKWFFT